MKKVLLFKSVSNETGDLMIDRLNDNNEQIVFQTNIYDRIYWEIGGGENDHLYINGTDILEYDMTYFRSWRRKQPIATAIALYLDHHKKKYIDTAVSMPRFGGKVLQTSLMDMNGIPVPKSLFVSVDMVLESWDRIVERLGLPFVMKADSGQKGRDNYLVKAKSEIEEIISSEVERQGTKLKQEAFIFQQAIPNDFDYRLLVLGDEVRVAEKRIRASNETHLNNVSAGGTEVFIPVEDVDKYSEIAVRSANIFGRQVAGVDLMVSKETGQPYILEVNPSPGLTYNDTSPELSELTNYLIGLVK